MVLESVEVVFGTVGDIAGSTGIVDESESVIDTEDTLTGGFGDFTVLESSR